MKELCPYIQAYIRNWSYINRLEEYKWEAVRYFQATFDVNNQSITTSAISALSKHVNLLDTSKYFPLGMLNEVYQERKSLIDGLLNDLYDESKPLKERIVSYISEFDKTVEEMANEGHSDWRGRDNLQSFQDPHAISVYLFLRFPSSHYIYKYSIFDAFSKIVEYKRTSTDKVDRLIEFYGLCKEVKEILLKEKEFVKMYNSWMQSKGYTDTEYHLLTQDFIYAVVRYLNSEAYSKSDKKRPIVLDEPIELEASEFPEIEKKGLKKFKGLKDIDYVKRDKYYRGLGLLGEEWVLLYEKERLRRLGISHKVIHTSVEEGDGKGYDIESVEEDGITPRYIEVKTTTGDYNQPFYYSDTELEFSNLNSGHYYIYRVYNFKDASKPANLIIIHGRMKDLHGKPVTYKAEINKIT